jgi:hypothetical protein
VSLRFLQYVRINVRREEFLPSPMNLACQKTCKSLLQVKQRFVTYFSSRKRASLAPSSVWRKKRGCLVAAAPRCVLLRLE